MDHANSYDGKLSKFKEKSANPTGPCVLRSSKSPLFIFPKGFAPDSDFGWASQSFAQLFYRQWKTRKNEFKTPALEDTPSKAKDESTDKQLQSLVGDVVGLWNKRKDVPKVTCTPDPQTGNIAIKTQNGDLAIGTIGFRGDLFGRYQDNNVLSAGYSVDNKSKIKQYVRDRNGTLVPRFVYRAIKTVTSGKVIDSSLVKALKEDGEYPEGALVQDKKTNKIKADEHANGDLAAHVLGRKPSLWLSYTTIPSGATNAQGNKFGNLYLMVDLWQVQQTQDWIFFYLGCREGVDRKSVV